MSSPESSIDELFSRLAVRYGTAFIAQYDGLDLKVVKADWARVLRGLTVGAIRHGLGCLPADRAVNAMQFRALCIPFLRDERQPALPAPRVAADPERVRLAVAQIKAAPCAPSTLEKLSSRDPRTLTQFQREALRALQARADAQQQSSGPEASA